MKLKTAIYTHECPKCHKTIHLDNMKKSKCIHCGLKLICYRDTLSHEHDETIASCKLNP